MQEKPCDTVYASLSVRHLVLPAAQAAADHVGLQLRPPAQLHGLVIPGQSGLTLPIHHQHKLYHPLIRHTDDTVTRVGFINPAAQI